MITSLSEGVNRSGSKMESVSAELLIIIPILQLLYWFRVVPYVYVVVLPVDYPDLRASCRVKLFDS